MASGDPYLRPVSDRIEIGLGGPIRRVLFESVMPFDSTCGNPTTTRVLAGSMDQPLFTRAEDVEFVDVGPQPWRCPYCDSAMTAERVRCSQCGASREDVR